MERPETFSGILTGGTLLFYEYVHGRVAVLGAGDQTAWTW